MPSLSFQTTLTGSVAVIALRGELDVAGASLLENELDRITVDHEPETVVFDLSGLEFMDSTGLRLIVLADGRLQQEGRALALVQGPADVHRVFEITRMTERLRFVGSPAEVTG